MRRIFRTILLGLVMAALGLGVYGWLGYRDARMMGSELEMYADDLIATGRGGADLGAAYRSILLAVEDPAFGQHYGFDLTTPGAGTHTITQTLAKSVCFDDFRPGIASVRQTGCAIGLEVELTKRQIMALYLETVEMGPAPQGGWMTGLFMASEAHFDAVPSELSQADFIALVAVILAPAELTLADPPPELIERQARIARLIAGACEPEGRGDVWFEACASSDAQ